MVSGLEALRFHIEDMLEEVAHSDAPEESKEFATKFLESVLEEAEVQGGFNR